MRETAFSRSFRKNVPGYWERIENKVGPGMADIVGTLALDPWPLTVWVETKALDTWKGDLDLSPAQVVWHTRMARKRGLSFVLAKVNVETILVPGSMIRGSRPRDAWIRRSAWYLPTGVDWKGLECALLSYHRNTRHG